MVPYPLPCNLPLMLSVFESFRLVLDLVILGFVVVVLALVVIGFRHLLGLIASLAGLAVH